uniref:Uncharacterized protein n=1 Tax=Mola mola TaxID=94237 RepID=A0A3Q3XL01_MOLML
MDGGAESLIAVMYQTQGRAVEKAARTEAAAAAGGEGSASEGQGENNTRAVEDLMDLTGSLTYSKLSSECNIGDSNKNLIEGVVSPVLESKLTGMSLPSSNKLSIK